MDIGDGWVEYFDEAHNLPYYFNDLLKITQWDHPKAIQMATSLPSPHNPIDVDNDIDKYSDMDDADSVDLNACVPISEEKFIDYSDVPCNRTKAEMIGGQTVNYLNLAKDYKIQRQYTDPYKKILCALCKINPCTDIFFPCEHRCVCSSCIESESFCPDFKMNEMNGAGFCNCPICADIIKLILPHEGGGEVEKYWKWVLEVKPPLPSGFVRSFRHSEAAIRKVFINDAEKNLVKRSSGTCVLS